MSQKKWQGIDRHCQRCGEPVNSYYWPLRLVVYCQSCVSQLNEKGINISSSRRHYDKEFS